MYRSHSQCARYSTVRACRHCQNLLLLHSTLIPVSTHSHVLHDDRFRFVVELPTGRVTFVFPAQYLITVVRGAADSSAMSSTSSSIQQLTDNSAAMKLQRDSSSISNSSSVSAIAGVSGEQHQQQQQRQRAPSFVPEPVPSPSSSTPTAFNSSTYSSSGVTIGASPHHQQQQQQQQHVPASYSFDSSSASSTGASNAAASYSGAVLAAGLQGFDTAPNSSSDVFSDDGGLWHVTHTHTDTAATSHTADTNDVNNTSIDDATADSSFVQSPRSRAAALAHSAALSEHTDTAAAAAVAPAAAAAAAEEPNTLFAEPLETVLQEESVLQDDVDLTSSDHWPRGAPAQSTEYSSSPLRHDATAAVYNSSGIDQQQQQRQQLPLYDAGVSTNTAATGVGLFDRGEQYQQHQQQQQQKQPLQYQQQQQQYQQYQQQQQYQHQQDEALAAADILFGSDSGDERSAATSTTSAAAAAAWQLPSPTTTTVSTSPIVSTAAADVPAAMGQPLSSGIDAAAAFAAFSDDTDWLSSLSAAPAAPAQQQHTQQRQHANTIDNSSALAHGSSGDSGHAFLAAAAAAAGAVERSASCDISFLQHLQHTVAIPLDSGSSVPSVDAAIDAAADAFPVSSGSVNDSTAAADQQQQQQQQGDTSSSAEVPSDVI
jgi:hypothetical protein